MDEQPAETGNYAMENDDGPIVLLGGGGHARALLDVIIASGRRAAGWVGPAGKSGPGGLPRLGGDEDLADLRSRFGVAFVAVGQIRSPEPRRRLFRELRHLGYGLPTVVSPLARVASGVLVGAGTAVMHFALVNAGALVGENAIVNSRALVEHDVRVGNHCHIATGAILNGGAVVEDECFIGSGALLREGVRIGRGSIIGMGARIFSDVPAGSLISDRTAFKRCRHS